MMKAIPIILILFLLTGLSGCLQQTIPSEFHIIEDKTYSLNDVLHSILFNLPGNSSTISMTIFKPNGESYGTLQQAVPYKVNTYDFIIPGGIVLYYPGLWHIEYKIDDILGNYTFWVTGPTGLERFELEHYNFTANKLDFSVLNNGKAAGYVDVVVYNDKPCLVGGNVFYGKEYLNQKVYLRPGYRQTFSVQITDVNLDIDIRLNQDILEVP